MSKSTCEVFRQRILDNHAAGRQLDEGAATHLASCDACMDALEAAVASESPAEIEVPLELVDLLDAAIVRRVRPVVELFPSRQEPGVVRVRLDAWDRAGWKGLFLAERVGRPRMVAFLKPDDDGGGEDAGNTERVGRDARPKRMAPELEGDLSSTEREYELTEIQPPHLDASGNLVASYETMDGAMGRKCLVLQLVMEDGDVARFYAPFERQYGDRWRTELYVSGFPMPPGEGKDLAEECFSLAIADEASVLARLASQAPLEDGSA